MDETMSQKVESDAAAYVRSIAEKRGRPVELAEKGVVESQSWTEEEALEAGLIDYVAGSEAELLRLLDGTTVKRFDESETVLRTSGEVILIEMSLAQRILSVLSHPNIAYIFLSLGFLGLYFELSNPGAIIPGVAGVISLVLAFLALQVLPVNFAGLLLLILGLGLLIAEALTPAFGALGLGGAASFLIGSLILFEEQTIPGPALEVSWGVVLPVTLTLAMMFLFLTRLVVQAQKRPATTGREGMMGELGDAKTEIGKAGKVFVHGEYWNARSLQEIAAGEKVRVTAVNGLVLQVERASDS